jgi:3-methyladenine DNA glycosylase AlkC
MVQLLINHLTLPKLYKNKMVISKLFKIINHLIKKHNKLIKKIINNNLNQLTKFK